VAKTETLYVCQSCGAVHQKWHGRCPACEAWGTLVEEAPARAGSPRAARRGVPGAPPREPVALAAVDPLDAERIATGIEDLDRVLGGGLVPGSIVLLGGDPGVGKSTLMTMMLARVAAHRPALLVTGEESPSQVRLRAERIGGAGRIQVVAETDLDSVCATIEQTRPAVCVIDSVQTLWSSDLASAPGSVAQVREAAGRLLRVAKESGVAIVLIGHVTKDGAVAGPRVLEHLVDAVLLFEGDRTADLRLLRGAKNRFGRTDELGVFTMTSTGLETLEDPSMLVERDEIGGPGSVIASVLEGTRPLLLEMQALVAPSELAMPRRLANGYDRNRLAMLLAVLQRHAMLPLGSADVFVNVTGGVRVDEPAADLPVLLAIATAFRGEPSGPVVAFGEIGLTGRLRAVPQAERRLLEARKLGLVRAIAPPGTPSVPGIEVRTATTVAEALALVGATTAAVR
jgi:DNA repair protein RadA/Sms